MPARTPPEVTLSLSLSLSLCTEYELDALVAAGEAEDSMSPFEKLDLAVKESKVYTAEPIFDRPMRRSFLSGPVPMREPTREELLRDSAKRTLAEKQRREQEARLELEESRPTTVDPEQPVRRADQRPSYLLEQPGPRPVEQLVQRKLDILLSTETPPEDRACIAAKQVARLESKPIPPPSIAVQPIPTPTGAPPPMKKNNGKCAEQGCSEDAYSRGYCSRHYAKHRYAGDFEGLKAGKSEARDQQTATRKPRAAAGGGQALAAWRGCSRASLSFPTTTWGGAPANQASADGASWGAGRVEQQRGGVA